MVPVWLLYFPARGSQCFITLQQTFNFCPTPQRASSPATHKPQCVYFPARRIPAAPALNQDRTDPGAMEYCTSQAAQVATPASAVASDGAQRPPLFWALVLGVPGLALLCCGCLCFRCRRRLRPCLRCCRCCCRLCRCGNGGDGRAQGATLGFTEPNRTGIGGRTPL